MFMFRLSPDTVFWDDLFLTDVMPGVTSAENLRAIKVAAEFMAYDELGRYFGRSADNRKPVPYVVMFDNCYGSVEQDLTNRRLANGVDPLSAFKAVMAAKTRSMQPEVERDGLVMYAARPGEDIGDPFHDPTDTAAEDWSRHVGPLARRLAISMRGAAPGAPLSIGLLRRGMIDPKLDHGDRTDPATGPAYTISNSSDAVLATSFLGGPGPVPGPVDAPARDGNLGDIVLRSARVVETRIAPVLAAFAAAAWLFRSASHRHRPERRRPPVIQRISNGAGGRRRAVPEASSSHAGVR